MQTRLCGEMSRGQLQPSSLWARLKRCDICPRVCGAHRLEGQAGICGATDRVFVARAALHAWEEPPISGSSGSGTIFFSNCPLKCGFCQNRTISSGGWGAEVSQERLAQIMLELQDQGALNINLVTATHYAPQVIDAVLRARAQGLTLPVVYNTSSYERPDVIDALAQVVDVWLPDFKYASEDFACRLSRVAHYPRIALEALEHMVLSVEARGGRCCAGTEQQMLRGVIVRHLVLPGHVADSLRALDRLWDSFGNRIDLSVMNQYTPVCGAAGLPGFPELGRTLTEEEYGRVLHHADILGFERLWWQQGGTVGESFIPAFDATGVKTQAGARHV